MTYYLKHILQNQFKPYFITKKKSAFVLDFEI